MADGSQILDRIGGYYIRRFPGTPMISICWQERFKNRQSTRTADVDAAKQLLLEFVVRRQHGGRTIEAPPDEWKNAVHMLVIRKAADAKQRGLPFDLDDLYVFGLMARSQYRCPLSGIPFVWGPMNELRRSPWSPSIDRIENRQGYIRGNVRVICFAANLAMNSWGYDTLLRLANGVVDNHFHSHETP